MKENVLGCPDIIFGSKSWIFLIIYGVSLAFTLLFAINPLLYYNVRNLSNSSITFVNGVLEKISLRETIQVRIRELQAIPSQAISNNENEGYLSVNPEQSETSV